MLDWYTIISPELMRTAYQSTNEFAWPKKQALQVLSSLSANGYHLVGIDAWRPTKPGPTPYPYDWNIDRNPKSKTQPKTAREFIEKFEMLYGDGVKPVFNFTVSSKKI